MVGATGLEPNPYLPFQPFAGLGWQPKDRNGSQRNNCWTRIGHCRLPIRAGSGTLPQNRHHSAELDRVPRWDSAVRSLARRRRTFSGACEASADGVERFLSKSEIRACTVCGRDFELVRSWQRQCSPRTFVLRIAYARQLGENAGDVKVYVKLFPASGGPATGTVTPLHPSRVSGLEDNPPCPNRPRRTMALKYITQRTLAGSRLRRQDVVFDERPIRQAYPSRLTTSMIPA
jgi:hypothetical protein